MATFNTVDTPLGYNWFGGGKHLLVLIGYYMAVFFMRLVGYTVAKRLNHAD